MAEVDVSTDPSKLDLDRVYTWLTVVYWSEGRTRETVEKAAKNSLNFGAYIGGEQVGYARVVTDFATFAWVCDVVVDEVHRGKGIGKALMTEIVGHPQLKDIKRMVLKTKDAYSFYEQFGFEREPGSEDSMVREGTTV